MSKEIGYFSLEDLPETFEEDLLKKYIESKVNFTIQEYSVQKENGKSITKIGYLKSELKEISKLEEIDDSIVPNTNIKIKISYSRGNNKSVLTHNILAKNFKEGEEIIYLINYKEQILNQFIKAEGDEGLKFIDIPTIEKQRNVIKHFITVIGSNILSGSGIMNVSLPINIFDQRSLLEVFAHQCRLSPYFLEKAGTERDPIEKLKLSTAFAISRLHLSVTQLKPFNPIWGETFQCEIEGTNLYLEQSSHHPPIYHFLHLGKHFKAYGYQRPEASTKPNSITARTFGKYYVEYEDGVKHLIYPCDLLLNGTLIGDRFYQIYGKFYIVDEKNGLLSYIEFNPDTRGIFSKLFSKKKTFPDFFSGCIVKLSQANYNAKENSYSLNSDHTPLVKIRGEWTENCFLDDDEYWNYENFKHYPLRRMKYTLQSDSTLREDCLYLKENDEDMAAKAKVELEEIQRRDRRLRADWLKKEAKK